MKRFITSVAIFALCFAISVATVAAIGALVSTAAPAF